jgi:hypothetical protein
MIRYLIQWRACRRLNKLVAKQRASYEAEQFRRRRAAALKATRGMAT